MNKTTSCVAIHITRVNVFSKCLQKVADWKVFIRIHLQRTFSYPKKLLDPFEFRHWGFYCFYYPIKKVALESIEFDFIVFYYISFALILINSNFHIENKTRFNSTLFYSIELIIIESNSYFPWSRLTKNLQSKF